MWFLVYTITVPLQNHSGILQFGFAISMHIAHALCYMQATSGHDALLHMQIEVIFSIT